MHTEADLTYSKIAKIYDGFLTATGFKRGVERFLSRIPFALPEKPKILDAGCGTGLLTFHFARCFPDAEITAFDIDPAMLRAMRRIMEREIPSASRITIGRGDLKTPERFEPFPEGKTVAVPERSYDCVAVSGALEHVPLEESVVRLTRLLKPGGIFFNLWVRRNPVGAVLGMVYRFRPYSVLEMRRACAAAGLADIRVLRLSVEDFPANLSRIAIMAKRHSA